MPNHFSATTGLNRKTTLSAHAVKTTDHFLKLISTLGCEPLTDISFLSFFLSKKTQSGKGKWWKHVTKGKKEQLFKSFVKGHLSPGVFRPTERSYLRQNFGSSTLSEVKKLLTANTQRLVLLIPSFPTDEPIDCPMTILVTYAWIITSALPINGYWANLLLPKLLFLSFWKIVF